MYLISENPHNIFYQDEEDKNLLGAMKKQQASSSGEKVGESVLWHCIVGSFWSGAGSVTKMRFLRFSLHNI